VTEHEKYALGATKPGGFAEKGFHGDGGAQRPAAAAAADSEAVGLEFLSERPPWRCACCNVNCTSRPTLLVHAAGAKHKRRVSGLWVQVGEGVGSNSSAEIIGVVLKSSVSHYCGSRVDSVN
jgi:cell growth-regulating nucleolar protein